MKVGLTKILSILFVFILASCGVNEADENNYDNSINENGVTFLLKNGSISSPGKMKIINNSNQKIFVPFIIFPDCYFSNYTLDQKVNSNWKGLLFNEMENKWISATSRDTIMVICEMYKNPIEINPSQVYEITLSKVETEGEYRANIYFRYSQVMNPNSPDKKISLDYFVNK